MSSDDDSDEDGGDYGCQHKDLVTLIKVGDDGGDSIGDDDGSGDGGDCRKEVMTEKVVVVMVR